ncbi:ABC transporter permease [Streptomyces sp. NPDC001889]
MSGTRASGTADVFAAEWLKLRTVRSTAHLLGTVAVAVALACVLAASIAGTWDGLSGAEREGVALSPLEPLVAVVAQIALAVLGTLTITSEYATGMIRTTVVAVPGRVRLLGAKAGVVGVTGLAAGLAGVFTTSWLTRAIVGDRPVPFFSDESSHTPGLLFALSASVMALALLGLGLGALLRSTTGAVVTVVVLLYVGPLLTQHLPGPWGDRVTSLLPGSLPGQLAGTGNDDSVYGAVLPPWAAAAVLCLYALLPLAVAAVRMRGRDIAGR